MKIVLPENISEITLEQFQRYDKLEQRKDLDPFQFNKRKVEIFTSLSYHQLDNVANKDFIELVAQIDLALSKGYEFINRFKIEGLEFGFIPNFDNITAAEFVDTTKYGTEAETLHNLMAIFFRPVTHEDNFDNYKIDNYNGTAKYADIIKQMPMHIVNGALGFFCRLTKELLISTQKYTVAELKKVERLPTSLRNGVGMQHLTM